MSDGMIRGECQVAGNHSSTGEHRWPTHFVAVPRVGEYVRSSGGWELPVWKVLHRMVHGAPRLIVEIGRPPVAGESYSITRDDDEAPPTAAMGLTLDPTLQPPPFSRGGGT